LLFYTDGLTEARNERDELFGNERVCTLLGTLRHQQAREIIESFYAAVRDFTASETFQDDISLVVLKIL
jgi:sigma-B regulation protein RsbU (phosphoserine phosphatase)